MSLLLSVNQQTLAVPGDCYSWGHTRPPGHIYHHLTAACSSGSQAQGARWGWRCWFWAVGSKEILKQGLYGEMQFGNDALVALRCEYSQGRRRTQKTF